MGIVIGPIEFEGPYADAGCLKAEAGLYAILCENKGEYELVELDESSSVKTCFDADEYTSNLRFWQETSANNLMAVVHYTPELNGEERRSIKDQLLQEFQ